MAGATHLERPMSNLSTPVPARNVSNWRLSGVEAEVSQRLAELAGRGLPQPAFDVAGCTDDELRHEHDRLAEVSRAARPARRR